MGKILAAIFVFVSHFAFAQSSVAKLKFEEAEEAYANNDLEVALTKLKETEAILKATNPRILYLQVLTQEKIIAKDTLKDYAIIEHTRKSIDKYLKDYDNLPDNEDKYRDIYKASERFKAMPASLQDFNMRVNKIAKRKQDLIDANDLALKKSQTYIAKFAQRYGFTPNMALKDFAAIAPENQKLADKKPKKETDGGYVYYIRNTTGVFSVPSGPFEIHTDQQDQLTFLLFIVEKGSVSSRVAKFTDLVKEIRQNIDSQYIKDVKTGSSKTGDFTGVSVSVPGTNFNLKTTVDGTSCDLHFGVFR